MKNIFSASSPCKNKTKIVSLIYFSDGKKNVDPLITINVPVIKNKSTDLFWRLIEWLLYDRSTGR